MVAMRELTVLNPESTTTVPARWADGSVIVDGAGLEAAFGWSLEEQGLCRGDVCVPVPAGSAVRRPDGADLVATAELLGSSCLVDAEHGVVAVGVAEARRRSALQGRRAPDFTLPDLDGVDRSLEEFADRKRLLVAFASW